MMGLLYGKIRTFYICFVFSVIISGDIATYFIEMIMLVVWKVPRLKP